MRLVELLPVLGALVMHALSHERWLLAAPAGVLLLAAVMLGKQPRYSARLLLISAVVGGGAGFALTGMWPVPGPIPPVVMGPLCGALVGLSTITALCGRQHYAIIYALLLASLSAAVRGSAAVYVGMAIVAVCLLVVAFARGRLGQAGLAGLVGFGAFALVVMGTSFGLWSFVRASEGVLTNTLFRLIQDAPRPSGLALQSEITLERRGRMPDTERLLMEVRGSRPEKLRTVVLDAFDGVRWKTSRTLEQSRLKLVPPKQEESMHSTELTLLQSLRPYLPAPAGIRSVEGANPQVVGGWMLRGDGKEGTTLTLRHEGREQLPQEPAPDAALASLPEELRAELRPLALEITRGATTPRARAEALERWFRDNFQYSLSVDLSGEGSPLAVFVRERRPAWCIYFASAMAAMLRSVDVPARLAGGFVPQEENPFSGAFLVRERDAHAWVEVYLEEEGRFVAFDPTPWQSRDALLAPQAKGRVGSALQAIASFFRRWTSSLLSLEALGALLVIAAGVWWRLRARGRRQRVERPREAMRGTDPRLAAIYTRYLRAMKRGAGLVPGASETDEELLLRLRAARGDDAANMAHAFIKLYRQVRFGGAVSDFDSLVALATALDRQLRDH
jgi:transglutaminase-like putative cysteine protease